MTLKSDLIAAKALIDTPKKLARVGSVRAACELACGGEIERAASAFRAFFDQSGDPDPIPYGPRASRVSFKSFLRRFDRAISAAPDDEVA